MTDIKGEIDRKTVIARGLITPLTSINRSQRQKSNKETAALNDTLNQMGLTAISRAFHPKAAEYTYFSRARGTFSSVDHML